MKELDFNKYLYWYEMDELEPEEIVLGEGYTVVTWYDISPSEYPKYIPGMWSLED